MSVSYKPRLCHVERGVNGYGFHLHGEKGKFGQSIRKVEPDSAAEHAGVKVGDKIVAVNGQNVEEESHQQVVARIKERSGETDLLVADEAAYKYFKDNNVEITAELITNGLSIEEPATQVNEDSGNSDNEVRPRLCRLVKGEEGYGFNLHSEKGKKGRFIRSVDDGGSADVAGLKTGDRIIEINGINMEFEKHGMLVNAIKESDGIVDLLVVDEVADKFFKQCNVTPSSAHIGGDLPTITESISKPEVTPPASPTNDIPAPSVESPATESAPQSNGVDLLTMDLNALKEKSRASRKKAPTSNWNNRQAIFNNL